MFNFYKLHFILCFDDMENGETMRSVANEVQTFERISVGKIADKMKSC